MFGESGWRGAGSHCGRVVGEAYKVFEGVLLDLDGKFVIGGMSLLLIDWLRQKRPLFGQSQGLRDMRRGSGA
jgi:hypothetical protein